MKLEFRGWGREVKTHTHAVAPIKDTPGKYIPGKGPIEWKSAFKALGKIENAALTGAFLVEFSFEAEELRNWAMKFAQEQPEAAIRLIAELQAEAIISLHSKSNAEKAQK